MVVFGSWLVLPLGASTLLLLLDAQLKMSILQVLLHIEAQVDIQKMEHDKVTKGTICYPCNYPEVDTCQTGQASYASIRTLPSFQLYWCFCLKIYTMCNNKLYFIGSHSTYKVHSHPVNSTHNLKKEMENVSILEKLLGSWTSLFSLSDSFHFILTKTKLRWYKGQTTPDYCCCRLLEYIVIPNPLYML